MSFQLISPLDANRILSRKLFDSPWGKTSAGQKVLFEWLYDNDGSIGKEFSRYDMMDW